MPKKRQPRPRDPIQLGKMIVDIATGAVPDEIEDSRDPAAVSLGQRGGKKGGPARAASLTPERRAEIARKAARSRWFKKK